MCDKCVLRVVAVVVFVAAVVQQFGMYDPAMNRMLSHQTTDQMSYPCGSYHRDGATDHSMGWTLIERFHHC